MSNSADDEYADTMPVLPPEVLALIVAATQGQPNALETLESLCETDARFASICRTSFIDPGQVDPSLRAFLVKIDNEGEGASGRLVSPREIAWASRRRDAMRTCVRYAIYSGIATRPGTCSAGEGRELIPFAEFANLDQSPDFMGQTLVLTAYPPDHLIITKNRNAVVDIIFEEGPTSARVRTIPDMATRALINGILTQAAIRGLVDTDSTGEAPVLCSHIDIFAAYPEVLNTFSQKESRYHQGTVEMMLDLSPILYPHGRVAFAQTYLKPMLQRAGTWSSYAARRWGLQS